MKQYNRQWKRPGMTPPKFEELFLPFSIFGFTVRVFISDDILGTARYVADRDYLKEPDCGRGAEAFTASSPDNGYSHIYLRPNAAVGTIAHESYHAVCAMLKMIGSAEEHEIVAYHLGYIVDAIAAFNLKVAGRFSCKKS